MNRALVKCPRCKNMVKPTRKSNRQSGWQKAFFPFANYYGAFVWSCPICDFRLPKDESNDRNHEFEWIDETSPPNYQQQSVRTKIYCNSCGTENPCDSNFCSKCGQTLAKT